MFLDAATEQKNLKTTMHIRSILEKSNNLRTEDEIGEVVDLIKQNKFF